MHVCICSACMHVCAHVVCVCVCACVCALWPCVLYIHIHTHVRRYCTYICLKYKSPPYNTYTYLMHTYITTDGGITTDIEVIISSSYQVSSWSCELYHWYVQYVYMTHCINDHSSVHNVTHWVIIVIMCTCTGCSVSQSVWCHQNYRGSCSLCKCHPLVKYIPYG